MLFQGFTMSLALLFLYFLLGLKMITLVPGHHLCQFICIHIFSGADRKTSSENSNITKKMKNMNELEELKFEIRKISFESDELGLIRDLYMYDNLNYR